MFLKLLTLSRKSLTSFMQYQVFVLSILFSKAFYFFVTFLWASHAPKQKVKIVIFYFLLNDLAPIRSVTKERKQHNKEVSSIKENLKGTLFFSKHPIFIAIKKWQKLLAVLWLHFLWCSFSSSRVSKTIHFH